MIVVFYGQPHSGKTTLAQAYQRLLFLKEGWHIPIVDGDEIREIFQNKDFSKEGRLRNLARISDISTYLASKYPVVLIAAVYPIAEARAYLSGLNGGVIWVELTYDNARGREKFHVEQFDAFIPSENDKYLKINTDLNSIDSCLEMVSNLIKDSI